MIKIIFIADIIGKIGRNAINLYLPHLKKKYQPDLVIANAENLAHGIGFTKKTLDEMHTAGIDGFTSGNHAWEKAGSDEVLNNLSNKIIRPANYPKTKSGKGWMEFKIGENNLIVINLLGRVFIDEKVHSPFAVLDKIIAKDRKALYLVDFHAEATSEKAALANYFDGRVAAIIGTHTHVQTADEQILEGGTGFISDAGMVGYKDSIIGSNRQQILNMFLGIGKSSKKHDLPAYGKVILNAVYLEICPRQRKTIKIERINKIIEVK